MRTTVLLFGSFDPLHEGHRWLFTEAKKRGDHLTVVVTRDGVIRSTKLHEPYSTEGQRLQAVKNVSVVDEVLLGDQDPASYTLLKNKPFDVLVLGYDQAPSDQEVRTLLDSCGRQEVEIIRLPAYKPLHYKSSLLREGN